MCPQINPNVLLICLPEEDSENPTARNLEGIAVRSGALEKTKLGGTTTPPPVHRNTAEERK